MPCMCAVVDCSNHSSKKLDRKIIFHTFPTNKVNRKRWKDLCKRKDKFNLSTSYICSDHFTEDDYERDLRNELLGIPVRRKLIKGAVPSRFPLRKRPDSNLISERQKRASIRERKSFVAEILKTAEEKENAPPAPSNITFTDEACQTKETAKSIQRLRERLENLKRQHQRQISRIKRLKAENASLRTRLKSRKPKPTLVKTENNLLSLKQQKRLLGKRVHWSTQDIVKSLSLRSISLKAYETVQQIWKLPLPSARTLRRWTANFKCTPGHLAEVLEIMSTQAKSMDTWEKICVLSFDEMSVSSLFEYDKTLDCIASGSKAQVIMARGICGNWKQPIYFHFDTPVTKDLLRSVIEKLEAAGYPVYGIVSDLGAENRKLHSELGIGQKHICFKNPVDKNRNIYVFADVPHMLKLIRNHILDQGIILPDGTVIDKSTFEELIKKDDSELKLCEHLNHKLIDVTGAERMRVRPAARLLSDHVAKLARKFIPDQPSIAEFIQLINDCFDILNSRTKIDDKKPLKSAFGVDLGRQISLLERLYELINNSRFFMPYENKNDRKPRQSPIFCQLGLMMSIRSTVGLFRELQATVSGFEYLLTSRLNQDCLESLFSTIRSYGGANTNPTSVDFRYRLRLILVGSRIRSPKGTNCEFEENINIMSASLIQKNKLLSMQPSDSLPGNFNFPKSLRCRSTNDYLDPDSLQYLAGYIAFRLQKDEKGVFGSATPASFKANDNWISVLSRGRLITPTNELHTWIKQCNHCFVTFTKTHGFIEGLRKKSTEFTRNCHPDIPLFVINEFLKIRIKIRTRHLNSNNSSSAVKRRIAKAKQFVKSKPRK